MTCVFLKKTITCVKAVRKSYMSEVSYVLPKALWSPNHETNPHDQIYNYCPDDLSCPRVSTIMCSVKMYSKIIIFTRINSHAIKWAVFPRFCCLVNSQNQMSKGIAGWLVLVFSLAMSLQRHRVPSKHNRPLTKDAMSLTKDTMSLRMFSKWNQSAKIHTKSANGLPSSRLSTTTLTIYSSKKLHVKSFMFAVSPSLLLDLIDSKWEKHQPEILWVQSKDPELHEFFSPSYIALQQLGASPKKCEGLVHGASAGASHTENTILKTFDPDAKTFRPCPVLI